MKTRRFFLVPALICFAAIANQLPASTAEMQLSAQPGAFLQAATPLPAYEIAFLFCLTAAFCWTLLWVSVLKLMRTDSGKPAYFR